MSSKFITESELAEVKRKRQEEWEKVRNGDDPEEAPEEPYDGRSLYERLKEQKSKKDLEYEEAHKLKNLIRGLDDEEVHFLDLIDQHKYENEKKQQLEVEKELEDYRKQVAALQEKSITKLENTVTKKSPKVTKTLSTQKALLNGIIKKPATTLTHATGEGNSTKDCSQPSSNLKRKSTDLADEGIAKGALKCVAVLPGIGCYKDSSDSEMSSGSEEEISNEKFDLCGRKRQKKCEQEQ